MRASLREGAAELAALVRKAGTITSGLADFVESKSEQILHNVTEDANKAAKDLDQNSGGSPHEGSQENAKSTDESKKPSQAKRKAGPKEVQKWADQFPKKNTPNNGDPRNTYEIQQTGPTNTQVQGGGEKIWADGISPSDGALQDAKYIADPTKSPYVDGSKVPDFIRQNIRDDFEDEVRRYGAVIKDPSTPVGSLQIITNEPQAVPYFQSVLNAQQVPGSVVVKP